MARFSQFGGEIAAIAILGLSFLVPFVTDSPFVYSTQNLIAVAVTAAFSVYIMLRMDLLTFAVPAFMAIGGYAAAIAGLKGGIVDSFALTALSFIAPALVALPLGILILRLRGIYFVLVTFLLTQILQLLIFETPDLTGGTNGLVGMPATTLFGIELADNRAVLLLAIGVAFAAAVITALVSVWLRREFAAIEENEVLAQSLGLVVWRYKVIGFVAAAGLAGMAGFSLVNMLLTAHPTSFSPQSSVNYIAYTIIGGRGSMLGPLVGATLLVWMSSIFSTHGEFSEGLYGLLIVVVVLAARGGIVGTLAAGYRRLSGQWRAGGSAAPIVGTVKEAAHERG
ncbi:branched-chain amino acid ABC transporter permease [Bosea sp. (in: a-proteobacteria)]|uniref:branched-chain amino acid ABC transporter permease n=1 Tax=Bosea sp. (in: a-proteobacteria) TaxID=1871050 RepID=UPI003340EF7E